MKFVLYQSPVGLLIAVVSAWDELFQ